MVRVNAYSSAHLVKGQGVGSAALEQMRLVQDLDECDLVVNSYFKNKDININHFHTIDLLYYVTIKLSKKVNVAYAHFIPETLFDSLKIPKIFQGIVSKYLMSFYKSADYVVVVNPMFKDRLIELGVKKEQVLYIPNFVSKETFFEKSKEEIVEIKKSYGLSESDFVVFGAGQIQTRKGVQDFVKVAQMLPNITFVWAGGFSFGKITKGYEELKEIVDNPPHNVKFLGIVPREDMNDLFNMADVLFVPSYNELFPMTILECMNTNTPMLLRDLELYEPILFDFYLKANNNETFKDELLKLSEDCNFYDKMVEKSREGSKMYSRENVKKQWRDFYCEIAK